MNPIVNKMDAIVSKNIYTLDKSRNFVSKSNKSETKKTRSTFVIGTH